MGNPVLFLLVGPNGAGKTEFYESVLKEVTNLPFINADVIAAAHWPDDPVAHSYQAGQFAEAERLYRVARRSSFVTETVFSHPSKLEFCQQARAAGYRIFLHVILVPEELAVVRVAERVRAGVGHHVPEEKIRQRYHRLWPLVRRAMDLADVTEVRDNSGTRDPFSVVALFDRGRLLSAKWPRWTPAALREHSAAARR